MSDARTRIQEAARAIFLEGGAPAVTMRAVAARVGVTATALYRHYADKEALLTEVIGSGFEVFAGYLYRALEAPTAEARLRRSGEAYLRFALEQPHLYRTIFMTPRGEEISKSVSPGSQAASTFRFLVDRVRDCMAEGVLEQGSPEEVAHTIWAHVHGLVSLQIVGAAGESPEQFARTYQASLERLFRGLTNVNRRGGDA